MKSRYKEKLPHYTVNTDKLFYSPIDAGHTCGECKKASYCRDICRKSHLLAGFGTDSSTHCMFEQSIFEPATAKR